MAAPAAGAEASEVDQLDADGARILRFDRVERLLHATNGLLVLVLLVTGTTFYAGGVQALVGHRALVRQVHVWCGIGLVVPWAVVLAGRWRRGVLLDVARLGRWTRDDWRWLRSRGRRALDRVGKFNAGQKLNAVFVAGVLPVMLMTGAIMQWHDPFPDSWRTGATFVHDVLWAGLGVAIVAHIAKAVSEPVALRAMLGRGWVPVRWARQARPRWHREVQGSRDGTDPAP